LIVDNGRGNVVVVLSFVNFQIPTKKHPPMILAHLQTAVLKAFVLLGQAPAPAPNVNVTSTRNYYFDIAIVVLLMGGALFAICRSSHRS